MKINSLKSLLSLASLNNITLSSGVSVPGKVRIFDEKGEIMVESKFPTGINYQQAEYEGGIGIHETGNRGTRIGLNMYESILRLLGN